MSTNTWGALSTLLLALAADAGGGATAITPGDVDEADFIDPRAVSIVTAASQRVAAASEFSFEFATEVAYTDAEQQRVTRSIEGRLDLDREHGIRAVVGNRRLFYDRSRFAIVDTGVGVYAEEPAPAGLDQALDEAMERYDLAFPAADFLFSNPYQALMSGVVSGSYQGRTEIGGHAVDHLSFTQAGIDWEIWIDAESEPLPRMMLLTYKLEPDAPTRRLEFKSWQWDPDLNPGDFRLSPDPALEQIEFLHEEGAP